jgi:hypothetical protein
MRPRGGRVESVVGQECRRVHAAQPARSRVPDDDRLHAIDSVHADDFCVRHHPELTLGGSAEAPQACRHSRVPRTQHNERTLAAPHRIHGRRDCDCLVAGHNEIDG